MARFSPSHTFDSPASGTNLQNITELKELLHLNCADTEQCIQVYDSIEAQTPFYQLAGQEALKHNVLRWIRDVFHCLVRGLSLFS